MLTMSPLNEVMEMRRTTNFILDFHLPSPQHLKILIFQAKPLFALLTVLSLYSAASIFAWMCDFCMVYFHRRQMLCLPDSLKLDHGVCEKVKPIIIASQVELRDMQSRHHEKTVEISGNAKRSLGDVYKVSISVWVNPFVWLPVSLNIWRHAHFVVC